MCVFVSKYVNRKGSQAMLIVKSSADVAIRGESEESIACRQ